MHESRKRASSASVIWHIVVRPTRLMIVCGEQSLPHSGDVSKATSYLHPKGLGGQEHEGIKPVEPLTPRVKGPGSQAVYGES